MRLGAALGWLGSFGPRRLPTHGFRLPHAAPPKPRGPQLRLRESTRRLQARQGRASVAALYPTFDSTPLRLHIQQENTMTPAIIRIVLRYLAAFLIAKGVIDPSLGGVSTDPDVIATIETVVGLMVAGATELWYWAAVRFGWRK